MRAYNATAAEIVTAAGIEINDLHAVIESAGIETCYNEDGVHMNPTGNAALTDAVADRLVQAIEDVS